MASLTHSTKKTVADTVKMHDSSTTGTRVSKTVRKPAAPEPKKKVLKKRRIRHFLRRAAPRDWTFNKDERVYVREPNRPDVHKFSLIYLHYASGTPMEYFKNDGFQAPGLRVILPKAPVFRSLMYGKKLYSQKAGPRTAKSRLWYDYYHDHKDPTEDPSQGADAEELWNCLESEEEKEQQKKRKKAAGLPPDEEKEEEWDSSIEADEHLKFADFVKTVKPDMHPETHKPKEAQVQKSIDRVLALIHKEAAALGGDYSRVYLGGWSQGAVLAMIAAIHKDCPSIGGCMTICGTCHDDMIDDACKAPKSTPFLLYVAAKDDLYPVMLLKPQIDRLRAHGYQIDLREMAMDHCLQGQLGPLDDPEGFWIKKWIEGMYQENSLGALLQAQPAPAPALDAKDQEAALRVVYGLLFGNQLPHSRRGEIMKYSCWEAGMADMHRRVEKLSAADLALAGKFFGAPKGCAAADLARFLATPTAAGMAALGGGPAEMDLN